MSDPNQDQPAALPEWVVTFGDMMSLLLTFFIMLVSLSEIKQQEKYQALVESFRRQFGHDTASNSMAPGHQKPRNSQIAKLASQGRAMRSDTMNGGDRVESARGENPRVRSLRPGQRTAVGALVYFAEDRTTPTNEDRAELQRSAL